MKLLSIDFIKQHSRIEYDCEDALLEMYGDSSEMTMAQYLNRGKTVDDMITSLTEEYGSVPAPIYHATLELVDQSYNHRSPASPQNMYFVLYNFDTLVKPYMKLV